MVERLRRYDVVDYEQAVFISYAWGGEREDLVNEIDGTLQRRGIRIVRDKRALGYRGSIKEFMERIGRGSCIIVVISDKYLRSPNCMFELVEIAENKQFHDRIFPIVLTDANIYDPLKRIEYIRFWEGKRKELAKAMKTLDPANLHGIREEMDQYDRIRDKISGITTILKDMNTLTPDMHRDSEFSNLYNAIVARLKESATDVTTEFDEMATKAAADRKAKEDREAKAEGERLAKIEAEADHKVKEEANRATAEQAPKPKTQPEAARSTIARKKTVPIGLVIGIGVFVLLVLSVIGFSIYSKYTATEINLAGTYTEAVQNCSSVTRTHDVSIASVGGTSYKLIRDGQQTGEGTLNGIKLHVVWSEYDGNSAVVRDYTLLSDGNLTYSSSGCTDSLIPK